MKGWDRQKGAQVDRSGVCSQQKVYRADLNYLRGAAWIATGALQIEGYKKASDLISDVRHKSLDTSPASRPPSLTLAGREIIKY